jgi:hypothetical protein
MNWQMFASVDPVIWMRITRCAFYFVAAMLMLREPMLCGGKNTTLHRMLAGLFFVSSWYTFSIARLRMQTTALGQAAIIQDVSMASEIAMTAAVIGLSCKLGYDYVRWRQYHKLECTKRACAEDSCIAKMELGPRGEERRLAR